MDHAASLKAENNRMAFSPPSPFSPSHSGACSPHNGESRLSDITGLFLYQHKKEEKGVGRGGLGVEGGRGFDKSRTRPRLFKREMAADDYIVAFCTEGTSEPRLCAMRSGVVCRIAARYRRKQVWGLVNTSGGEEKKNKKRCLWLKLQNFGSGIIPL